MRMRCLKVLTSLVVGTVALTPIVAAQSVAHGRVSFADESGLVKGTEDDDWSFATVNTLIYPGDTLWADDSGTIEVEFSAGAFLRMADNSKAEIVSLPPDTELRGWIGSFYIQRTNRSTGNVIFSTPVGPVKVDVDSQVRFDILSDGSTTITVRWGQALLNPANETPLVIGQGQRTYLDPGYLPSTPLSFDLAQEDSFDQWNRERSRLLALGREHLPIELGDGEIEPLGLSDLNGNGDWIYEDNNYYWRPTVHTIEYVPYRQGYWSYQPHYGYAWVGQYPFSYITSHYGNWHHHSQYGWIWRYGHTYAPAHVSAIRYGNSFIWAPSDLHGNPVYHYGAHFSVGGLNFSILASSSIHADDLLHGHGSIHAVANHHIQPHHERNAHIWDLFAHNDHNIHAPRHNAALPARNYSPDRVLRNPSGSVHSRHAGDRVARLESLQHRSGFSAQTRSGHGTLRTARISTSRSAAVRQVHLRNASTPQRARVMQQAQRASMATRSLMARNRHITSPSNVEALNMRTRPVGRVSSGSGRVQNSTIRTERAAPAGARSRALSSRSGLTMNRSSGRVITRNEPASSTARPRTLSTPETRRANGNQSSRASTTLRSSNPRTAEPTQRIASTRQPRTGPTNPRMMPPPTSSPRMRPAPGPRSPRVSTSSPRSPQIITARPSAPRSRPASPRVAASPQTRRPSPVASPRRSAASPRGGMRSVQSPSNRPQTRVGSPSRMQSRSFAASSRSMRAPSSRMSSGRSASRSMSSRAGRGR